MLGSAWVSASVIAVAVVAALILIYRFMILPRSRKWGASAEEVQRALPGDDLVPTPRAGFTEAITI